jgi:hypothetical protein
MRTDNAYFEEKKQSAKHGSFKLPEDEGKKNINEAKKAPPHNLEGPVSIQL